MALTYGFYNSKNHDRMYDAVQLSQIFDGLIHDGVYATEGDHFLVSAGNIANTVVVGSGRAWFLHTWTYNDGPVLVTLPESHATRYRYDAVVLDINANSDVRENQFMVVSGQSVGLADPSDWTNVPKPIFINENMHLQVPLAYVKRYPLRDDVTNADIISTVGSEEEGCPWVKGVIEYISTDALLQHAESDWNNFMSATEQDLARWKTDKGEILQDEIAAINDLLYILPIEHGGTGNMSGCIQVGHKSGTVIGFRSTCEGFETSATGSQCHAEGNATKAYGDYSHAEGNQTEADESQSHAEGNSTKASGSSSHAEGSETEASGSQSHAEGNQTEASGSSSHAEGSNTIASGSSSHAEGSRTEVSGDYSHAEGYITIASGNYSHAEGDETIASNSSAHAEGSQTEASDSSAHAEGFQSKASGHASHAECVGTEASGSQSHAEGYNTKSSGSSSHAEGSSTIASGVSSHAEGSNTKASGDHSHAEGNQTEASAYYSHAEGYSAKASGSQSHAEGYIAIASGSSSHAEGSETEASGSQSHAEGSQTEASSDYSHAEGYGTKASGISSHAEGFETEASGFYSHAEGFRSKAYGNDSHAGGGGIAALVGQFVHGIVGFGGSQIKVTSDQTYAIGNKEYLNGCSFDIASNVSVTIRTNKYASGETINVRCLVFVISDFSSIDITAVTIADNTDALPVKHTLLRHGTTISNIPEIVVNGDSNGGYINIPSSAGKKYCQIIRLM